MTTKKRKIVIFGDSVLRPIILKDNRYTISKEVDWEALENMLDIQIENRSRMGSTVKNGYNYISDYLKNDNDFYAALVEYGGNDCDYDWEAVAGDSTISHPPKICVSEYEKTLNQILDLLFQNNIKPILMTLPPISAQKYYDWIRRKGLNEDNLMHHLQDIERIYRHQEYYSNLNKKIAYERGVDLADVRQSFLLRRDYMSLICDDGVHPNADGEQVIVQTFIDQYANAPRSNQISSLRCSQLD